MYDLFVPMAQDAPQVAIVAVQIWHDGNNMDVYALEGAVSCSCLKAKR